MGRIMRGEGVFRGGGVKRKTWGRSGEKVWEGERRGLRRIGWREGGYVWIGFWGVGEVTYLFYVNFFDQIRAKNPRLIGFLTR